MLVAWSFIAQHIFWQQLKLLITFNNYSVWFKRDSNETWTIIKILFGAFKVLRCYEKKTLGTLGNNKELFVERVYVFLELLIIYWLNEILNKYFYIPLVNYNFSVFK